MPHPLQSTITNLVLMGVNRRAAELVVLQEGLTDIEDALDFLGTYPSGRRPPRAKRSARKPRMLHAEQAAAHSGDGLFFEVWFEEAKPLIVACGVRAAPSAHIYARGVRGPPLRRHCARAAALIVMPPTM